MKKKTKNM